MTWAEREGDAGIRSMCDYGVQHRGDRTIKFECFNKAERDRIHEYMEATYPGVPFFCEWIEFRKDEL